MYTGISARKGFDEHTFYEPEKPTRQIKPSFLSQFSRFFTRRKKTKCNPTEFSLPTDLLQREFRQLRNGDFEVLPFESHGIGFKEVLDRMDPRERKEGVFSKFNKLFSRCVKNIVPHNFVLDDTVPHYRIDGDLIFFNPRGARVNLTYFMNHLENHDQHFGGVKRFGTSRVRWRRRRMTRRRW